MRRRDRLAAAPPPQPPGFEFVIIFAAESKIFALDPFVGEGGGRGNSLSLLDDSPLFFRGFQQWGGDSSSLLFSRSMMLDCSKFTTNEISQPRCYSILFPVPMNNRINHEIFISSNRTRGNINSVSYLCGRLKIHHRGWEEEEGRSV